MGILPIEIKGDIKISGTEVVSFDIDNLNVKRK